MKGHVMTMTVAFSGHRPPKLGLTYSKTGPADLHIISDMVELLISNEATDIISGMALGVDQLAVRAANQLGLPYAAYIPFPDQDSRWPAAGRAEYKTMLEQAASIDYIAKEYSPQAFQDRNEAMVNDSDLLIAYWDGSFGGTKNCIDYAREIDHPRMIRRGT